LARLEVRQWAILLLCPLPIPRAQDLKFRVLSLSVIKT
jgi:hypothetical protein